MEETKQLTKKQIYLQEYYQRPEVKQRQKEYNQRPEVKQKRKEYNQRPEVEEKKNLSNKKLHDCECGSYYSTCHRKQHIAGVIHQRYLETGIKFIKKESEMNKKYYNDKLTAHHLLQ